MKRNSDLLNKTARHIAKVPSSYQQITFYRPNASTPCGAVACLAGEIIICSERTVQEGVAKLRHVINAYRDSWDDTVDDPQTVAARLAGFTDEEADYLFDATVDTWPSPFREEFAANEAKAAAGLLRYLAKGGKV